MLRCHIRAHSSASIVFSCGWQLRLVSRRVVVLLLRLALLTCGSERTLVRVTGIGGVASCVLPVLTTLLHVGVAVASRRLTEVFLDSLSVALHGEKGDPSLKVGRRKLCFAAECGFKYVHGESERWLESNTLWGADSRRLSWAAIYKASDRHRRITLPASIDSTARLVCDVLRLSTAQAWSFASQQPQRFVLNCTHHWHERRSFGVFNQPWPQWLTRDTPTLCQVLNYVHVPHCNYMYRLFWFFGNWTYVVGLTQTYECENWEEGEGDGSFNVRLSVRILQFSLAPLVSQEAEADEPEEGPQSWKTVEIRLLRHCGLF